VRITRLEEDNVQLWILLHKTASQSQVLERELNIEKYCRVEKTGKNDKSDKTTKFATQINEFLNSVQASVPEACTEENTMEAMTFIHTQPYATHIFRPTETMEAMHVARQEYLRDLLTTQHVHPSTRLLILVQPAEENPEARAAAINLGTQFKELIKKQYLQQPDVPILGPHLLPCRLRKEVLNHFNGPMDVTLPREPKEGQPRIRIWLFISNC
jgi:hypothetical protein